MEVGDTVRRLEDRMLGEVVSEANDPEYAWVRFDDGTQQIMHVSQLMLLELVTGIEAD